MARYAVSSLGRLFVIDENLQYLPAIRKIFAVITALIGLITFTRFLLVLISKKRTSFRLVNLGKTIGGRVVLMYICSHLIHSIHYVDNICRPVHYFEPKWLYQKYWISEMEITFFANFPISIVGLYFMERLVAAINNGNYQGTVNYCKKMIFYVIASLLTLGHYFTEPPWKYEPFVNFTIAGEGIATILLALFLYQLRTESLSHMTQSPDIEQSTGLLDDENEREQTEYSMKFTGLQVRSRTPVKS